MFLILWNHLFCEFFFDSLPKKCSSEKKKQNLSPYWVQETVRSHSSLKGMLWIAEVSKVGMKLSGENMLGCWLDFTSQFLWDPTQFLVSFYVYMYRETGDRESYLGKENIDRPLMRKRLSLQWYSIQQKLIKHLLCACHCAEKSPCCKFRH